MMKKLSIIVPVYNVELYVKQCVQTLINQTYKHIEIILVDDGSTDSSGRICDNLAKEDGRIIVLHGENEGLSGARNKGLAHATGEYIGFVDSDDFVDEHMYEELITVLEAHDLDIVTCHAFRYVNGKVQGHEGSGDIRYINRDVALKEALLDKHTAAWNKVYTRRAIGDVRFPVGRKFEDSATNYLFINNIRRMAEVDKRLYYYRFNPTSITQTSSDPKSRYDFVVTYKERLDFVKAHNLPYEDICNSLLMKSVLSCLTAVYGSERLDDNYIWKQCEALIYTYRCKDSYKLLNGKYKLFLWSFGRFDWIHRIGAKLSFLAKGIKKKRM